MIICLSGEQQDTDLVCSISQLKYRVGKAEITGVYIRFLASTSSKVFGCFFVSEFYYIIYIKTDQTNEDKENT